MGGRDLTGGGGGGRTRTGGKFIGLDPDSLAGVVSGFETRDGAGGGAEREAGRGGPGLLGRFWSSAMSFARRFWRGSFKPSAPHRG
jgi:hypothetical protein